MEDARENEDRHRNINSVAPPDRTGDPLPQGPAARCCAALQETKVINELFPAEPLQKLGYVHQAIHGQKAYYGVAIVSRLPFKKDRHAGFLPRMPLPGI